MGRQAKRHEIKLRGKSYRLLNVELRWLIRLAAETFATTDNYRGKHPYEHAYLRAKGELRQLTRPGKLEQERWTKLLAAGCAIESLEGKFIESACENVWLAGKSTEFVHELVADALQYADDKVFESDSGDGYEITPKGYSRLLKLESQASLRNLVGQYLIFRRHWSDPKVVVAHMSVWQDRLALYPAYFETRTKIPDNSRKRRLAPYDTIRGVMYVTPDEEGVVFAIGRYIGTKQVRLTILERVPESRDLAGVRLGLNDSRPAGYQVWCTALGNELSESDWLNFCGEYDLGHAKERGRKAAPRLSDDQTFFKAYGDNPHQYFQQRIGALPEILDHLCVGPVASPI